MPIELLVAGSAGLTIPSSIRPTHDVSLEQFLVEMRHRGARASEPEAVPGFVLSGGVPATASAVLRLPILEPESVPFVLRAFHRSTNFAPALLILLGCASVLIFCPG